MGRMVAVRLCRPILYASIAFSMMLGVYLLLVRDNPPVVLVHSANDLLPETPNYSQHSGQMSNVLAAVTTSSPLLASEDVLAVKHRFLQEETKLFRLAYVNSSVLHETLAKAQQLLDTKEYKGVLLGSERSSADNTGSDEYTLPYNISSFQEREKFQKAAMVEFCQQHPETGSMPADEVRQYDLFKHLLYDDEKEVIFCYVPKVGCSNWKRMFAVLNGLLPPTESTERPAEDTLRKVKRLVHLKPAEREWRLRKYFKFIMLRNPLERLVSAYRNKVRIPVDYEHKWVFPSREAIFMLTKFEAHRYREWMRGGHKKTIWPTFDSFLQFSTYFPRTHLNEHYKPVMELCHPCVVQYNMYTNFKYLPADAFWIMDLLKIPRYYYLNIESHPQTPTSALLDNFFNGNVTNRSVFINFLTSWHDELQLYYSLFPEEQGMHLRFIKTLSSTNYPL